MDKGGGGEVLRWFRRAIRTSKIGSLDFLQMDRVSIIYYRCFRYILFIFLFLIPRNYWWVLEFVGSVG